MTEEIEKTSFSNNSEVAVNPNKRKAQLILDRPRRLRRSIDRYGVNNFESENDDHLFDEADSLRNFPSDRPSGTENQIDGMNDAVQKSSDNATQQCGTEKDENFNDINLTPAEKLILSHLLNIKSELFVINKRLLNIEMQLATSKTKRSSSTPDSHLLKQLSLPVKSEEELEQFEQKLNDSEFRMKVVSVNFPKKFSSVNLIPFKTKLCSSLMH